MRNNCDNLDFLESRKKSLRLRLQRQARRMTSFRAPKEMTTKLLRFHTDDISTEGKFQRRKRAFLSQRKKKHSFRVPRELTPLLLSETFIEDLDKRELAQKTRQAVSGMNVLAVDSPKCTRETPRRYINRQTPNEIKSSSLPKKHSSYTSSHVGMPKRQPMARRSSQTACTA